MIVWTLLLGLAAVITAVPSHPLTGLHGVPNPAGSVATHPAGANMTVPELIAHYQYPVEVHHVTTEDGYILELHRIPHGIKRGGTRPQPPRGGKRPVVFLSHCLTCSSAAWVMNAPDEALAYILADFGYDVWMGNFRGNDYSRHHKWLSPNWQKSFWQFSWDEMGTVDLPAMLDYALAETQQHTLDYVGFSMGTTTFLALASDKPEYNDKINSAALLGPVAYSSHVTGLMATVARYFSAVDSMMTLFWTGEIFRNNKVIDQYATQFCDKDSRYAVICYYAISLMSGFDNQETNKDWLPVFVAHIPSGTSVHTINHYGQVQASGIFRKYDYGILNFFHYGQTTPPKFDLNNIRLPVGLYYGLNDNLADPEDVLQLKNELPNVQDFFEVPWAQWNHFDFIMSKNSSKWVYPEVIKFLQKHSPTPIEKL